jgi:hypothetical protein
MAMVSWGTKLAPPVLGWQERLFPCERCFNCSCACVTDPAQVALLQQRVRERHRKSVQRARNSDHWSAAVAASIRRLEAS